MERQRRLFVEDEPLKLAVMLEESVLDRPIGGADVLHGQLEHVLRLVEHENIEVRVLPTAIGSHEGLVGPFTVLDFAKAQSIAYVELVNGAFYVQVALSPEESAGVIRSRLTT